MCRWRPTCSADQAARRRLARAVQLEALCRRRVRCGSGAFARECFCEGAEVFLDLCRDAVRVTELYQWSQREYELLSAARRIVRV